LSARKNQLLYQECNNRFGHGHDYVLEVTFRGKIDPITGMGVGLTAMERIIHREVVERYDHRHLNYDVEDFKGLVPTGENILRVIWKRLSEKVPMQKIDRLKLIETSNNYFEYYG
jgi:6-pyruvoyltetrahydropterin/6-carboxytetrahydropterin synthase